MHLVILNLISNENMFNKYLIFTGDSILLVANWQMVLLVIIQLERLSGASQLRALVD